MSALIIGIIFVIAWAHVVWRYWHEDDTSLTKDLMYNTILFVLLTIGGTYIVYWVMCNTMFAFMLFG